MRRLFSTLLFGVTACAQVSAQITPPLYGFLPNTGQFPPAVRFFHYAVDNYFYVTHDSFVLSNGVRIQVAGITTSAQPVGVSPSAPIYNFYQGKDSSKWLANSPLFGAVNLGTAYPEITVSFSTSISQTLFGNVGQVIYTIAPGADPSLIRLNVLDTGTTPFVGASNDIWYAGGNIPGTFIVSVQATQVSGGTSVPLDSNLNIESANMLSIQIPKRNPALETDVVVSFPDFDDFTQVLSGRLVAAYVDSLSDFGVDGAIPGPKCDPNCTSALVARLDKNGNPIWVSILGGVKGGESADAATQTSSGVAASGQTGSGDFPITANAAHQTPGSSGDLFLALLDSGTGHLLDSTYAGLQGLAYIGDQVAESGGDVAVSGGISLSNNQTAGYVLRWRPAENRFIYSLPFESEVRSLAFDSSSNLYFCVTQNSQAKPVLVGEVDPIGNPVGSVVAIDVPSYGTAFGAAQLQPLDGGDVWTTYNVGVASSSSAYVAKLSPIHDQVLVNRRLVNQGNVEDLGLTPLGNLKLLIQGASPTEAITPDAQLAGQCYLSQYFMILAPDGTTVYASYVGQLFDFASQNESNGSPAPSVACFSDGASHLSSAGISAAPGQLINVIGAGFGPVVPIYTGPDSDGKYPQKAGGFSVRIGGIYAPVFSVARGMITAQVPYSLVYSPNAPYTLEVFDDGKALDPILLGITPYFFGLFETGVWNDETNLPVLTAANEDGTINGPDNPAPGGSVVSLFGTGLGVLSPPLKTGALSPTPPAGPLSRTALLNECSGCGDIQYMGSAPGLSTGVVQTNVRIPVNAPGEGVRPLSINISLSATKEDLGLEAVTYGVIFIK